MKPISKKNKNIGLIVSIVLNGGCFMMIPFMPSCDIEADPPFPTEKVVMVMDFTEAGGGGQSGGAESISEEVSQTAKESNSDSQTESVETESKVTDSKVTQKDPKKNDSKENGSSTSSNNPANDFSNVFGGGGGSDGGGGGSQGTGIGPGSGPSIGPNSGTGNGDGRKVVSKPALTNPTQEEGRVMVEVTIDQDGNVTKAVAKRSHSKTTTSNETLIKQAEKLAKQFKFSKDDNGPALQTTTFAINFTLE
jgi:TonB family protein